MSRKKTDYFWLSYSDLMTSLFFIMLVLFVLVYSIIKYQQGKLIEKLAEYEKLEEIKAAINNIDTTYFYYNKEYKKHILKISVQYKKGVSNISSLPITTRKKLVRAGQSIKKLLNRLPKDKNIYYLIIVEGQASKDNYWGNDILSFERALGLKKLWNNNNLNFNSLSNCELIIAGSGQGGVPRLTPDTPPKNQRFLIQIIPKVGIIKYKK